MNPEELARLQAEAEAEAELELEMEKQSAPIASGSQPWSRERFQELTDTVVGGATLGAGKYVKALANVLRPYPGEMERPSYSEALQEVEQGLEQGRQRSPVSSAILYGAGASIPGAAIPAARQVIPAAQGSIGKAPRAVEIARRLAYGGGTAAIPGAIAAYNEGQDPIEAAKFSGMVGMGGQAVDEIATALAQGPRSFQRYYEDESLGVTTAAEKQGIKKSATYRDELGNPVQSGEKAATFTSHIDDEMEVLRNDNFFETLPNNPRKAAASVRNRADELTLELKALMSDAAGEVKGIKLQPDWSKAKEYINELTKTDPETAKSLAKTLKAIQKEWSKGAGDLNELIERGRLFGKAAKFNAIKSDADNAKAALQQEIWKGFRDSIDTVINKVYSVKDPSKVGMLQELNHKVHAYLTIKELAELNPGKNFIQALDALKTLSLGGFGVGAHLAFHNPVLTGAFVAPVVARTASRMYPASAARQYKAIADTLSGGGISAASRSAGIAGQRLYQE